MLGDERKIFERTVGHDYLVDRRVSVLSCPLGQDHLRAIPGLWTAISKAKNRERSGEEWDVWDVGGSALVEHLGARPRGDLRRAEERLVADWRRAKLREAGDRIAERLRTDAPDGELEEELRAALAVLQMSGGSRGVTLSEALREAARIHLSELKDSRSIPMAVASMQRVYGGWRRGKLHLIAAPTSQHKTTLAVQSFRHAGQQGCRGLYITLEDDATDIAERVAVSSIDGLTLTALVDRSKIDTQHGRRLEKWRRMVDEPWTKKQTIVDATLDLSQLEGEIRTNAARGLDLCVVDFMQLIQRTNPRTDPTQHMADCATRLQALAKELDLCVICCVQPTQDATRNEKPLSLGDIRGGAAIAQAAFAVLVCHRPTVEALGEPPKVRPLEVFVRKWKKGPVQPFSLMVEGGRDRIYEVER